MTSAFWQRQDEENRAPKAQEMRGNRSDEYNIAGLCVCPLDYGLHFILGHKLGKGGGNALVGQPYPCKTLGTHTFCFLGKAVDDLAGVNAGGVFGLKPLTVPPSLTVFAKTPKPLFTTMSEISKSSIPKRVSGLSLPKRFIASA